MTTPAISLISDKNFEIEVYIPEIDIANVKVGNLANITLDAYGSDVIFNGKVVFIDPASTILEGVPSYRTLLQFNNEDERIKVGMTANVDVITAYKENVLAIPIKAVINEDNRKIVRVITNEKLANPPIEERQIKTGISDINGNIEIIEGLNLNELVLIP
jgi:HlyD family secretion protein